MSLRKGIILTEFMIGQKLIAWNFRGTITITLLLSQPI